MSALSIPLVTPEDDTLTAALKYAEAGWYVGPGRRDDRKNPGRILGKKWQTKTSRDPKTIAAWFAGTDHLLFLHCGRSGAWVADVDHPERVPDVLAEAIDRQRPPHQSSRPDVPFRGHYVFRQPEDRVIGNGAGRLGKDWGEGRGNNGVVFVCPSPHKNAAEGARYEWLGTGEVPEMTPELSAALSDATGSVDAATDAAVEAFLAEHTRESHPGWSGGPMTTFARLAESGSRHNALVEACCWAAREALIGFYPAEAAFAALTEAFADAMAGGGDRQLDRSEAQAEARGAIAWGIAQATAEGAEAIWRRPQYQKEAQGGRSGTPSEDQAQPGASTDAPSSWEPVDLAGYLDGTYRPPSAGLLFRTDGVGLLYPGRVHWFHGESESGKSWVAQIAAAECLNRGETVLYIDHESSPDEIVARLLALGVGAQAIRERLAYVHPHSAARTDPETFTRLLGRHYALAVLDGVTEALGLDGAKSESNDDVTAWVRRMPRRIAETTGAATVCIDHVTKSEDGRGRFAIGAQAKMAGVTGASYMVEPVKTIARGVEGLLRLRVAKDRPGAVRAHGGQTRASDRSQEIARIAFNAVNPEAITYSVGVPVGGVDESTGEVREFRPTVLMEKVSEALRTMDTIANPHGYTGNQINLAVSGRKQAIASAVAILVREGYVSTATRGGQGGQSVRHRLIKPYFRMSDPLDDEHGARNGATAGSKTDSGNDHEGSSEGVPTGSPEVVPPLKGGENAGTTSGEGPVTGSGNHSGTSSGTTSTSENSGNHFGGGSGDSILGTTWEPLPHDLGGLKIHTADRKTAGEDHSEDHQRNGHKIAKQPWPERSDGHPLPSEMTPEERRLYALALGIPINPEESA